MKHSGMRSEEAHSLPLGSSLSVLTSAVPYIPAQSGLWCESGLPSFTLSDSPRASASTHKCRGKQSRPQWLRIYSLYLLLLAAIWVIRRSVADVFFPAEDHDLTKGGEGEIFLQSVQGESVVWKRWPELLHYPLLSLPSDFRGITQTLHLDR